MALPGETLRQVRNAIHLILGGAPLCPLCRRSNLQLVPHGFAFIAIHEGLPPTGAYTGIGLPSVVLLCETCGHTELINLIMLGLEHLASGKVVE